jgi:hypothetical protein
VREHLSDAVKVHSYWRKVMRNHNFERMAAKRQAFQTRIKPCGAIQGWRMRYVREALASDPEENTQTTVLSLSERCAGGQLLSR